MAMTNYERVQKGLELLREGLGPFVAREIQAKIQQGRLRREDLRGFVDDPMLKDRPVAEWDASALLRLVWDTWHSVFREVFGHTERSLVSEIREWRNRWAHQEKFTSDDTDRALDSIERLLTAVSATEQAEAVRKLKLDLRRRVFREQVREETRRAGGSLFEMAAAGALPAWRDVITPHPDVASGKYQQAEFAADLWQVHLGEASGEYQDPREFFERTYLTESLRRLLVGAAERLAGKGGDPVVQLQTNFGGGKTHSMLALYHLVSGTPVRELPGVEEVLAEAGIESVPRARRVVLVGNRISPGNPSKKPDGTVVRTLWGELAWQLGGAEAYARVAEDDRNATSPGDVLRELFVEYGPCLVLIDEWVAYARQLHDEGDLPGGSFETQFTFAQALTESAKLAGNCLLVISLPSSDTAGSPHATAEDVEVGGVRGREALERLRNVVGRLESSWRPATAEEGFEIVRRRLFQPLSGQEAFRKRDLVARAFRELYREHRDDFPGECGERDYEQRIQAAYPIHPEVFDRLYGDWSTLVKFQRTRGVLRLMAAVIHGLWREGDRSPLIVPASIPLDDPRVQFELTRYLSDNWAPIIETDIDGEGSLPVRIDGEAPNLGKLSATRRVARTIFLGSAPSKGAAHQGIEDRRIKLGCTLPGESPSVFGDALRRLAARATYLYQDGSRYWYDTKPTLTKIAKDRAEAMDPERVAEEVERRLRAATRERGKFARVHAIARDGADVPDGQDAALVVLGPEAAHTRSTGEGGPESDALATARKILESRGSAARIYRNTLVFLAPDRSRYQDLDWAVRMYLAWQSILEDRERLNLDPRQVRQAEEQLKVWSGNVETRLPETYQWLLVPREEAPGAGIEWKQFKLAGAEPLARRAAKRLKKEGALVTELAGSVLRMHLDSVPLWRGNHVSVRQLADDFASYLYLPRLAGPDVLAEAVKDGVGSLTWREDTFALADSYDEEKGRYRGLAAGPVLHLAPESDRLLVKPEVAEKQLEEEVGSGGPGGGGEGGGGPSSGGEEGGDDGEERPGGGDGGTTTLPRRFHGTVRLTPERVGRDAARVAEELVAHLVGQPGARVEVTLEIEAHLPNGADETLRRIVTENAAALKFDSHEFEEE